MEQIINNKLSYLEKLTVTSRWEADTFVWLQKRMDDVERDICSLHKFIDLKFNSKIHEYWEDKLVNFQSRLIDLVAKFQPIGD
jgi:hypothetical protein